MDSSKFNLWRACFSFCFIDGFLSPAEERWIEEKLTTLPFSADQRTQLMSDLKAQPNIAELLPLITRPADRGFLVNHLRMLAQLDGALSEAEVDKIHKVTGMVMQKIDLSGLEQQLSEISRAERKGEDMRSKLTFTQKVINDLVGLLSRGN
jgi:hypothetical protein